MINIRSLYLGETLEDSIKREVAEEVGLTVRSVDYKVSQHWSFPTSNLMIGCHAVVDGELTKIFELTIHQSRGK